MSTSKNAPAKKAPAAKSARGFAKRRDIIVIGAILLLAAIGFLLYYLTRSTGGTAEVMVLQANGQSHTYTISLLDDGLHEVEGTPFPVLLEVKNHGIRFLSSECPDHNCIYFGWLRYKNDFAICMPGGVYVNVLEAVPD